MSSVMIFIIPPHCFDSLKRKIYSIKRPDFPRRVTITVSKRKQRRGHKRRGNILFARRKPLVFETFHVHLHRAVVNQDNQEI